MVLRALCVASVALAGSPVNKVLELLNKLEKRIQYQGEVESKQYSEFAEWCEDQSREKEYEIEQGTAQSADLAATIEQTSGELVTRDAEVNDISQVIAANDGDLKAAREIRGKEHSNFLEEEKELVDTVDTLIRAQAVLSRQLRKGSLVQIPKAINDLTASLNVILNAAVFSTQDKSQLRALLQQKEDDTEDFGVGPPAAAAYESHSAGIMETLANMQDKAEGMLAEARKTEMTAKHNFELLEQSVKNELRIQNDKLSTTRKARAGAAEVKGQAGGDKAVVDKDLAENKEYLQDMTQNCKQRAADAERSQASRAEELKALKEAKRIISEKTGGANTREYALLQASSVDHSALDKAAKAIKQMGKRDGNIQMTQLVAQIRTAEMMAADPFAKVKDLIENMIARLIKEAAGEADHKAFCDKETQESEAKRNKHEATVEKLSTRIEKASAGVGKLKQQVAALQTELHDLSKSQAEMDKMRQQEQEEYVVAKKDYEDGLEGVRMALKILRDYYAQGAALVQQPSVSVHSQASDDATGIIGLLEVAESDFARSLAESQSDEDNAQNVYEKTTQDTRVSRATKESEVEYKTQEAARVESVIADAKGDRNSTQDELDAVLQYLEKLRPQCTTQPSSYEERKARRESEIEGLKRALEILETETITGSSDAFLALKTVRRHI